MLPIQTDSKPNCSARRASAARSSPRRCHKKLQISFFHLLVFYAHLADSLARYAAVAFASGMKCGFAVAALSHGLKCHRLRSVFVFIRRRELFLSPADVLLVSHEMGGGRFGV
jgi:hypothetical protein